MSNPTSENPEDIQCPVCGYYCIGNGGVGCIYKPDLQPQEQSESPQEPKNPSCLCGKPKLEQSEEWLDWIHAGIDSWISIDKEGKDFMNQEDIFNLKGWLSKSARREIEQAKKEEREWQYGLMMDSLPKDAENLSTLTESQALKLIQDFIRKHPWN